MYTVKKTVTKGNFCEKVSILDDKVQKIFSVNSYTPFEDIKNEFQILKALKKNDYTISLIDQRLDDNFKIILNFEKYDSDLESITEQKQMVSVAFVKAIGFKLLHCCNYLHRDFSFNKKIIHFDIKPANIFVNKFGSVKLCDFGLAKIMYKKDILDKDDDDFESVGSSAYKDVRFYDGYQFVDQKSDLWSVGCVLYELMFGRVRNFRTRIFLKELNDDIINFHPKINENERKNFVKLLSNMLSLSNDVRKCANKLLDFDFFKDMTNDKATEIIKKELKTQKDMNVLKNKHLNDIDIKFDIKKQQLDDSFNMNSDEDHNDDMFVSDSTMDLEESDDYYESDTDTESDNELYSDDDMKPSFTRVNKREKKELSKTIDLGVSDNESDDDDDDKEDLSFVDDEVMYDSNAEEDF